jgi:hypothetical protein
LSAKTDEELDNLYIEYIVLEDVWVVWRIFWIKSRIY